MGTLKSLSRTAACAIFAGLILFLGASVAEASAPAPKCGGLNENVCTTAAAKYEKNSCPKGAFSTRATAASAGTARRARIAPSSP